jgi:hypothetical protein
LTIGHGCPIIYILSTDEVFMAYIVQVREEMLPAGHKAMGVGIAYAMPATWAEAARYQLETGIRAFTEIVYLPDPEPFVPEIGHRDEITGLVWDGFQWVSPARKR